MEHAKGLTAITNPTTNSYHRLVPGYEAPVYIAWSSSNRSATIRIPGHFKGEKYAFMKRMEYRVPDPASNPYLVFSAVLAAGLDGIKKKIEPGDPVKEDIYKMTKSERKKHGIDTLPANLGSIVCAKIWLKKKEDHKIIAAKIKKYCSKKIERYKIPVKIKISSKKQYNKNYKKIRTL